jgi:type IV pilus assembly protein PilE
MNMRKKHHNGFTLIELVIVMAIVGILAVIAYPSYQNQIRNARRSDAQGALLELAQFMQRFHTVNNRYDQDTEGNPVALPFAQSPRDAGTTFYNLRLQAVTATNFILEAEPIGAQTGDSCGTISLTNASIKSPAECW